jgi:plasmid stability protein
MAGEILQVRDVDGADLAVLRERAARVGKSLSAYVRDLLHDEAASPTNAEVVARIAAEEPVEAGLDEVRGYIEAERSW